MSEIPPLFVGKLVNSSLLPAFPASIGEISTTFLIVPELCRGLINKSKEFLKIKEVSDLENLISYMSDFARDKAESKLGLRNKIELFKNEQVSLF